MRKNMKLFSKRGKESSLRAKKNYKAMKKNSFRFLATKQSLIIIGVVTFIASFIVGNALLFLVEQVIPNWRLYTGEDRYFLPPLLNSLFQFQLTNYPNYYLFLLIIASYITFICLLRVRTSFHSLEDEFTQGSMEWTRHEQLQKEYQEVPVTAFAADEDFFEGTPGLPISRVPRTKQEKKTGDFRYLVETMIGNMLILASTRIGKSRYFINAFIDIISRARDQKKRWSFIMTATKGTEPREWYNTLKKRGYKIRIYNTVNQYYSDPFPVLKVFFSFYKHYYRYKQEAEKQTDKKLKAKYLIQAEQQLANAENALRRAAQSYFIEVDSGKDGGFWTKACRNLFMSISLAVADQAIREGEETKVNPYTIYDIANEMITQKIDDKNTDFLKEYATSTHHLRKLVEKYQGSSHLDVYFRELPRTHPARKYYAAILASAPAKTTLGNVLTHFDGDLESFLQSANAKMTSWDDGFDIESIGFDEEAPSAVFIIMSDSDELNNRLGMLILDQIYQVLKNRADLAEDPSEAHCFRPVITIGDEIGNLGVSVPNLDRKWTAGLSRHLYFMLVLQDTSQLSTLYSEYIRNTIMGNLANLVYIRSGSKETNEYISDLLGKRAVYSKTRQKDPVSFKSTENESVERLGLLESFELSRLRDGESVVVRLNHGEDKDGNPIYQYPILNTFENDTNMIKFDEYRKMETVSWENIPVNNDFMSLDIEELLWSLHPFKEEGKGEVPTLEEIRLSSEHLKVKQKKKKGSSGKNKSKLPEQIAEQQSLFDSIPLYEEKEPTTKGGKKVNKLMDIEQAKDEIETRESQEKEWKKEVVTQYTSIFAEDLDLAFSAYFNQNRRREINKLIELQFKKKPIVMNEYRRITEIQDQQLISFFTFLVSNGDFTFNQKILSTLQQWRETAS